MFRCPRGRYLPQISQHFERYSTMQYLNELREFLDNLKIIPRKNEMAHITKAFMRIAEAHDVTACAVGLFSRLRVDDYSIIVNTYPKQWTDHYHTNNYLRCDPTISMSLFNSTTLVWSQMDNLTNEQKKVFDEVKEVGIYNGFTVPVHSHDGQVLIASFAHSNRHISTSVQNVLRIAAVYLFDYAVRNRVLLQNPSRKRNLTVRERECLLWVARGKSTWEISKILSISGGFEKPFGSELFCVIPFLRR